MEKSKIAKYLDEKGFKHSIKGFDFLITAISFCVEQPNKIHSICKLYAEVGKTHGTTPSRVERAIRHAIEANSNIIGDPDGRITNSEFIARARDYFIYGD